MVINVKPAARQRRANGNQTYSELIEAALALWGEGGVDRVTMNSVAERAGRTRGTVYHHFSDRDTLLTAVQDHLDRTMISMFTDNSFDPGNPYELVASLAAENPDLVRFYVHNILSRDPKTDPLIKNAIAYFRKLGKKGGLAADTNPDHVALVSIGMWFSATLAVSLGPTVKARRAEALRFAKTFEQLMNRAFLKPQGD